MSSWEVAYRIETIVVTTNRRRVMTKATRSGLGTLWMTVSASRAAWLFCNGWIVRLV